MRQDVLALRQELQEANQKINRKLDILAEEQFDDITAISKAINRRLDSIKKDIEFTYIKTSRNELEINRLKPRSEKASLE